MQNVQRYSNHRFTKRYLPHREAIMPLSTYPASIESAPADIRPPTTLTLAITDRCNLSCCHCWVAAGQQPNSPDVPEWSLLQMIEQFSALGGGTHPFHRRGTAAAPRLAAGHAVRRHHRPQCHHPANQRHAV